MSFSASSAAMEGFKLVKSKPGTFLAWCAIYFVFTLVLYGVMFSVMIPNMAAFSQAGAGASADPTVFFRTMGPIMLITYPPTLIWTVLFYTAIYRAILRPQDKGFAYLKLSGDELRIFGVILILGVAVVAIFAAMFGLLYLLRTTLGAAGALIGGLLAFIGYLAYIWAAIRLSLVLPQTLAEKRIDIAAAWRLTQGRFWKLLGMFLLSMLVVLGVVIGVYLLMAVVGVGAFAGMMAGGHPHFTAVSVILLLVFGLVGFCLALTLPTLMLVVIIAPAAAAYRALKGPVDVAGAFS